MTAVPLGIQGLSMAASSRSSNPGPSTTAYGVGVGLSGLGSLDDARRQLTYDRNVRRDPSTTQPARTDGRLVGDFGNILGGGAYGAGAGLGNPTVQAIGATVQAAGAGLALVTPQAMHYPDRNSYGTQLPHYDARVASSRAAASSPSVRAPSSSGSSQGRRDSSSSGVRVGTVEPRSRRARQSSPGSTRRSR